MSEVRIARTSSPATQKAVVQRRYQKQDEACEQAIKLLLARAVAKCDQHRDGEDGTAIKGDSAYGRSIP